MAQAGLAARVQDWEGEQVVAAFDAPTEAWMFIALHDTRLGPAAGGTRLASYAAPAEGLADAMRLAEGMTRKWACADMPFGGGKAVLAVPPTLSGDDRRGLLDRYAARLKTLRGAFRTGVDVGVTPDDMARVGAISGWAVGLVDGRVADPGPHTARGVLAGIRASLAHRFGTPDLAGRSVLVQGVGDVGLPLAVLLAEAGAAVRIADLLDDVAREAVARCRERGAAEPRAVPVDHVWDAEVDVYAPCALGGTLNSETIPRLRCAVVAGSANNQLRSEADAEALRARGILYAPDYVINAGGAVALTLIHAGERDETRLRTRVEAIGDRLRDIFEEAERADESPAHAARRRVLAKLAAADASSAAR